MIRPSSAALGLVAAVGLLVGACNSAPPGPALTDPKEIVTAALKSTEAAKSVHLDVTLDGTVSIALPGSPWRARSSPSTARRIRRRR